MYDSLSHANSLIDIVPGWSVSYFLSHIYYFHFDITLFLFSVLFQKKSKKTSCCCCDTQVLNTRLPSLNLKKNILLVNFK